LINVGSYFLTNPKRIASDVTGKMLLILFGLPILGVVLLVVWALSDSSEKPKDSADSEE